MSDDIDNELLMNSAAVDDFEPDATEYPPSEGDEGNEDLPDEPESTAAEEPEAGRKKLSSSQRKSRKIAAQARELAEKESRIAELLQELETASDTESDPPEFPHEYDFENDDDYFRALSTHSAETALRALRQEERQEAAYRELMHAEQDRQHLARQHFSERLETSKPRMPDFDDKVDHLLTRLETADVEVPQHVVEEIQASPEGPEILYLMAGDDGFLMELLQSTPVGAARSIGRREAALSTGKKQPRSAAPAPMRPPRGGAGGDRDPSSMTYQDYRRWRGFDGASA